MHRDHRGHTHTLTKAATTVLGHSVLAYGISPNFRFLPNETKPIPKVTYIYVVYDVIELFDLNYVGEKKWLVPVKWIVLHFSYFTTKIAQK